MIPVETIVDDYSQLKSCRALPCPDFSEDVISAEEKDVLYTVMRKFRSYTGKEIGNYMHEKTAYTRTKNREIIPYSLAKRSSLCEPDSKMHAPHPHDDRVPLRGC